MGKKVNVKNRSAGSVVYKVPDLRVRRDFLPGEVKTVDMDELVQLSYKTGGALLLSEYLQILDEPARKEIAGEVEPEYNYSDEDVKKLILNGSLDAFLDALDFAPVGVLDMIKKYSVSLPISDLNKVKALKDKLHFDVQAAIAANGEEAPAEEAPKKTRRVSKAGNDTGEKKSRRRTKAAPTE